MPPASKTLEIDPRWIEPSAGLAWFNPPERGDDVALFATSTGHPAGVFDE
jgi:hypothetical protein